MLMSVVIVQIFVPEQMYYLDGVTEEVRLVDNNPMR